MSIRRSVIGVLGLAVLTGGLGQVLYSRQAGKSCCVPLLAAAAYAAPPAKQKQPPKPQRKVIAYYFHGNYRCVSCKTIEAWTESTIKRSLASDIKAGRLEWRVVNIEQPGKEHFAKDYKLYTKSVILSDTKGGKETRWKNLDKVWEYLRDETKFRKYIQDEVSGYVRGA